MSRQGSNLTRFRLGDNPEKQAHIQVEAAHVLARQGDLAQATRLLRAATQLDPDCTDAWLQLAWLARNPVERKMLLQRVLSLQPGHRQARAELARLEQVIAGRPPRRRRPWGWVVAALLAIALLAAALVFGPVEISLARLLPTAIPAATATPTLTPAQVAGQFTPQLEAALAGRSWERAMEIVAIMQGVDPTGEEVRRQAYNAHMQYGRFLVAAGQVAAALGHFEQALVLMPQDAEAGAWRQVGEMYLAGSEALAAGDWPAAIDVLVRAHEQMPNFGDLGKRVVEAYREQGEAAGQAGDLTAAVEALAEAHRRAPGDALVTGLLADAYRRRGIEWQTAGDLPAARLDLEAALSLAPDDVEARTHYDQVMYILFPPKKIDIDISAQHFYAYEGDLLVYSFPTSTGLPGRDTATGHFKVLDKIPMAHSTVWSLDMPYWLGIYYVGNIENGIHALPIRPDGSIMWAGLLGQKASYGCVILSTEAARIIYDWADIGTEVVIHY